jgi:membrane protease subunit HflC
MSRTIDVEGGTRGPRPSRPNRGGSLKDLGRNLPPMVSLAAALAAILLLLGGFMAASGRLGVVSLDAQEVAVIVNYATGKREIINTPGYKIYVPFIQEVFKFDKRTQDFFMQGNKYVNANHVPQLTVRAQDGSNFRIDDLRIQYELMPGEATTVLNDSGPGDAYKQEWIKAHARSILRDEFGRFDAVDAADPTKYKAATPRAQERLNDLLGSHGIRITVINTPNPRFDTEYEEAIENRKQAQQEVERLKAQFQQLEQEMEMRLAAVEREKSVEMRELEGDLQKALWEAEREAVDVRRGSDAFATQRRAEGEAHQKQLVAEARGLEVKYRKEAEGIEAQAKALEQRGEVVVREAIIQKLLAIDFTLMPYSRDPQPKRLEHSDAREASHSVDPSTLREGN